MGCFRLLQIVGLGVALGSCDVVEVEQAAVVAELPSIVKTSQEGDIYVNQVGYVPNAPKLATIVRANNAPVTWRLRDAQNATVFSGTSIDFGLNPASGQSVHTIDFSAYTTPGDGYSLLIGGSSSASFSISSNIYQQLKIDALQYFPHNQAGTPIKSEFATAATPALTRQAGHKSEIVGCFVGEDTRGTQWTGCNYQLDVTGGWYDAGDYGKYTVGEGYAAWMMLNTYERLKLKQSYKMQPFRDGRLSIPRGQNGQNDLLDVARTGIEFMLKMQIPDGNTAELIRGAEPGGQVNILRQDVGGMVHHKVHADLDTPIPLRPSQDNLERALYPPSTAATLHLAAVGAQCARIWRDIDPAFSARCLTAARRGYAAALAVPDAYALDINYGGGGYEDEEINDEFFWATSELLITTGEAQYQNRLATYRSGVGASLQSRDAYWGYVEYFGLMSMLAQVPTYEGVAELPGYIRDARAGMLSVAERFYEEAEDSAYGLPYAGTNYYWGSNANLLSRSLVMAHAYEIGGNANYQKTVINVMDYLLGRNPMNTSYISGYGTNAMEKPHHRFWGNSMDATLPKPHPGTMSGGPNNINFLEPVAQALEGNCTGQTCWVDDAGAYTMNEVSIVWNSPLFWIATYLDGSNERGH